MFAVLKRELKKYYTSLTVYIYYTLFLLACGITFTVYCLNNYNTQFGYYVLSKAFYITVFMIPLFTMQMIAGEKRNNTDQLIFTSPITTYSVVIAKYLSCIIVSGIPVILSVIYPIIIAGHGDMSLDFVVCTYIAVFLGVFVLTAIGLFFSSITSNPIIAALLMYAFYALLLLMRIAEALSGQKLLYSLIHNISLYNIYYDMVSGIVRTGNLIYLIVLTILFIHLSWMVLIFNRINVYRKIIGTIAMIVCAILISLVCGVNSVTYDMTPEKILTLSDETIDVINNVYKDTKIYYMGRISNVNATYQEFLSLYEKQNDKISVIYVDFDENSLIKEQYLNDITMINEASILVACEDSYIYLDSDDYISTIQKSEKEYLSILEIESQLTEAIYNTNNTENKYVYMLSSNMEYGFTDKLTNKLKQNGYEIQGLYLLDNLKTVESTIPSKCDLLVMYSPEDDYTEDEINVLRSYINDGGKLIAFVDPLNEDLINLYSFFEEYGLSIESGIVIEKDENLYAYETQYYLAPKLNEHEITSSLIDSNFHVYTMTSKGIVVEDAMPGMVRTDLLITGRRAFSKKSDYDNISSKGEEDVGGPFSIASIIEAGNGRLSLITSNMLLDDDIDKDALGANSRFLINLFDYMTDNTDKVRITGKSVDYNTALYDRGFIKRSKILCIFIVPIVIIVSGIIIIIIRNKNIMIKKG